jgi:hypothetical protein
VGALVFIEAGVVGGLGRRGALVGVRIHLLVLDRFSEAFDDNVVPAAALGPMPPE